MREVGDEVDQANELAQMETDNRLYLARKKSKPEQEQRADGTWPQPDCFDCEGPIGDARLAMGRIRCIHCQTDLEAKEKLWGGRRP